MKKECERQSAQLVKVVLLRLESISALSVPQVSDVENEFEQQGEQHLLTQLQTDKTHFSQFVHALEKRPNVGFYVDARTTGSKLDRSSYSDNCEWFFVTEIVKTLDDYKIGCCMNYMMWHFCTDSMQTVKKRKKRKKTKNLEKVN